jgi:hypothetical protein
VFPIFDFLPLVLTSFLSIFGEAVFWIPLIIVGLLYRKMTKTSFYLFGTPGESPWRLTLIAALFGILGWFFGELFINFYRYFC